MCARNTESFAQCIENTRIVQRIRATNREKELLIYREKIMEKKIYKKPAMQVEAFIANDYCVNCKEDPAHQFVTYYFNCDAGGSQNNKFYVRDGSGNYATIAGNYMGPTEGYWEWNWGQREFIVTKQGHTYSPCGAYHEITVPRGTDISTVSGILTGYSIDDASTDAIENTPVTIWTGENNDNVHCTTILNPNDWSTDKS